MQLITISEHVIQYLTVHVVVLLHVSVWCITSGNLGLQYEIIALMAYGLQIAIYCIILTL